MRITEVGNAINRYILLTGQPPASLEQLMSVEQFAYLNSVITHDMSYAITTLVDDEINRKYSRAIVFYKRNLDETDGDWLASNDCGTGSFSSSSNWCKNDGSIMTILDNREYQSYLAAESIVRLDRAAQQLFNARENGFPKSHTGGELTDGDHITLSEAVNYTGDVSACSGVFNFDGAVLTCELLFALDGTPVHYIYEGRDSAILYTTLPFVNDADEPSRVVRSLKVY